MQTSIWFAVLSALILLILIVNIRNSRRFNLFDHWLHHKLVRNHDGFSWQIVAFINDPKLMVVWDILLASFLINEERNIIALWVIATLGFTDITGILLKRWMHRKRPIEHSDLEDGYSFPSGHVLGATCMVLIILQVFGKKLASWLVIALGIIWLMVVISRLSLKAHYPSDIIGATSLAIFCFTISQQILLAII
ncbi:phosphatase PAP2 family protein [Lactobacillus sp. ESL0677]|uniref:phosphatase PAP2 family protein n=1 Tax=Lactobacillus sp. ESL0677 TaxID=2983208 RepID=UPI0023F89C3F|nr:phosphatase PAP2 family protein [Lactobacillus sp. ESL0677]WEV36264.1 phosphatase PAP2 family protein [Lactobacillus sp. ESL0677]